jgi:broad specificity phosphatase PhoE
MTGKVHIVRHGQGWHNLLLEADPNSEDFRLHDAELTTSGVLQSVTINKTFPHMKNIGVVLTSPLRRSIQTALLAFSNIIHERFYSPGEGGIPDGVDLVVNPKLEEIDNDIWNSGSTAEDLRFEFPKLDFHLLTSEWPKKTGIFDPEMVKVELRAGMVRKDLWDRTNILAVETIKKDIVLVSHSGFIQVLMGGIDLDLKNGSYRTVDIYRSSTGNLYLS